MIGVTFCADFEFQGVFYPQNLNLSTLNPLRLGVRFFVHPGVRLSPWSRRSDGQPAVGGE